MGCVTVNFYIENVSTTCEVVIRRLNLCLFQGCALIVYWNVVDLCSGRDIFSSPAYYLQQNDVVYVTPNDTKKRSSTLNGNTVQSTGFWMSISSLIVTILTFLKVN